MEEIAEGDRKDLIEGEDWFLQGPRGLRSALWYWDEEWQPLLRRAIKMAGG
jgi:hypothetical protein